MTLEDIETLDCEYISVKTAAKYAQLSEQNIRCAARDGLLPWAYRVGSRTMI